jgi:hypothetical protein
MVTQLLTFSANKQADGEKNNRLQNATDLQHITANEASGAGLPPGIEIIHCKMQQSCNRSSIGNKGHHHRCSTSGSVEDDSSWRG